VDSEAIKKEAIGEGSLEEGVLKSAFDDPGCGRRAEGEQGAGFGTECADVEVLGISHGMVIME